MMPMFPLGLVLFPTAVLPLHVFEPRYRALTKDCLAGDREFGVVLIERGNEVGGGDVRASVGTVARILDSHEFDDGRWALHTVGTRRVRVTRWLDDDPYPRAEVEDWDDDPTGPGAHDAYERVRARLRRALALTTEMGEPAANFDIELADDPDLGSFQAAAVAPLGSLDQQDLLAAPSGRERLAKLDGLLAAHEESLRARLSLG